MMPLPVPRKTPGMEKVENLCRTATAQKILPAQFKSAAAWRVGGRRFAGSRNRPKPLPDM